MSKHTIRNIFISIHPNYADKIMAGMKTIELRRRFPDLDGTRGRLLIYSTSPIQAIIGYAEIEDVHYMTTRKIWSAYSRKAHIEKSDFARYFNGTSHGYAVELKNPKKFSKPLSMGYIKKRYGLTAPQSYRYLEGDLEDIFNYV